MALHTLEQDGTLGWTCPHCQSERSAHHSHEGVQHYRQDSIALPPCECGAQTFLNVHPDMRGIAPGSEAVMSRHLDLSKRLTEAGKGYGAIRFSYDPDGVMHYACLSCGAPQAKSIRTVGWADKETIVLPACACGNAPRLPASQYSELASKLREVGKAPNS